MTEPIPTWREALLNVDPQHPNIAALKHNAIANEIDELRTRLAEVEKDAARYQWLRTSCISDVKESMDGPGHKQLMFVGKIYPDWRFAIDHIGLDAAIDSAMGAQA